MTTATDPSSLLTPSGLIARDPGVEMLFVAPGTITAVRLAAGDRLTIIDLEGRQRAELTTLALPINGTAARFDGGAALSATATEPATVLKTLAASVGNGDLAGGGAIIDLLSGYGVDPGAATAAHLFGEWSVAGARESLTAVTDALALIAAPAVRMSVEDEAANPPTALELEIRRAAPLPTAAEQELPPPLAEPVLDLRIDAATALSYEVKEGQYIQIIDVFGRQCSDFLAFGARQLQNGIERGLDSTTTRYIMGNLYPQPGLFGKFYDQDAQPLIEIVQDTVGRHDTFGLGCTPKFYADMGYPGHVNCTDNFNAQLDRFSVAPRAGWSALNFFYNTTLDGDHQIVFDEPWSRPGDYVLIRAMSDLVCASSACPDDIDPANGWVPTDIHVRVYDAKQKFSTAIARRVVPEAKATLTKETGFHPRTSALTKQFTEYKGYWLPSSYDNHGAIEEYWACRERVAVMDLSPLRKFEVLGPDAEALMQAIVTRDIRKLSHGQVVYSAVCTETGGMLDDCTVFRLGDTNFRFVCGDEYCGHWLRDQAQRLGLEKVWIKNSSDHLHNIAVQGPKSRDLLNEIIWTPDTQPQMADLGWFRFLIGRVGDHNGIPLLVSRTGYTGELGYELWVHPNDAPALWDVVMETGKKYGIRPLGLDAVDMLRIEAALIFAGYDFDEETDPFEAGIGFTVPLATKQDDFIGRDALLARKEHPQRTLVGLELEGNEVAGHGDCVHVGKPQIGVITSGTRSPILRKNIALCRIAVQYAEPGTEVEVGKLDGHQKRIAAKVVPLSFYDPKKERPRS